jgi:ATP-dependent exoDNAse (exonuclease V) alpha subunit
VANRELGRIEHIEPSGVFKIRLDSGRQVRLVASEHPHLDHGYAVTSHSGQGQTADRVLVHVDTKLSEQLVNRRLAYVSISRGRFDAQVFTDDVSQLERVLTRDVEHHSALSVAESGLNRDKHGMTSALAVRASHAISQEP